MTARHPVSGRRHSMIDTWNRSCGAFVTLAALVACLVAAPASGQLTAGKEYQALDFPQPVATGDRIEVIEFFYYGCPYCNEALPLIVKWLPSLPADVQYRRVPVVRPDSWAPLARTYYALESLGRLDGLHRHVFDSIHIDGLALSDETAMFDWVQRNYIDRQMFIDAYRSADTTAKVAKALDLSDKYNITRIPAIAIDGKYVTTTGMAGGLDAMLRAVDQLIVRARAERAAKK
jgi:thiol:disulfide interchange protein DsbA